MAGKHDGNFRRRVSADGHETRVTERELSGVAVDEIQADGKNDIDADVNHHAEVVAVEVRGEIRNDRRHQDGREQKSFGAGVHWFPFCRRAISSRYAFLNKAFLISS